MDSLSAFAMGLANRDKELMVFDWLKAAQLIVEKGAIYASAGLKSDWEYTGGKIFQNGKPVAQEDTYTYLASTWAIPELELTYSDGTAEVFDCYKMQSQTPNWDAHTFWPDEALSILTSNK